MYLEKVKLIIKLGRLHFLIAGFLLYLLGVFLAVALNHQFSWERFIWGYAVFLPAHLMVNYSNEYFDRDVDRFSKKTNFSGGSGVLLDHPGLAGFTKKLSLYMIAISIILGVIFSYVYNSWQFLILTLSGNFLGWFYTAPPLRFSYRGLGEIATVLTGFLMPGLGYVAISGSISLAFVIFTIPLMLFLLLFILSVEIPDREADQKGGKKTFIVRFGRYNALKLTVICSVLASLSFLVMPIDMFYPINLNIIALLSIIPFISTIRAFLSRSSSLMVLNKRTTHNVTALILYISLVNIYIFTI